MTSAPPTRLRPDESEARLGQRVRGAGSWFGVVFAPHQEIAALEDPDGLHSPAAGPWRELAGALRYHRRRLYAVVDRDLEWDERGETGNRCGREERE